MDNAELTEQNGAWKWGFWSNKDGDLQIYNHTGDIPVI